MMLIHHLLVLLSTSASRCKLVRRPTIVYGIIALDRCVDGSQDHLVRQDTANGSDTDDDSDGDFLGFSDDVMHGLKVMSKLLSTVTRYWMFPTFQDGITTHLFPL